MLAERFLRWAIRLLVVGGLLLNCDLQFTCFVLAAILTLAASIAAALEWDQEWKEARMWLSAPPGFDLLTQTHS